MIAGTATDLGGIHAALGAALDEKKIDYGTKVIWVRVLTKTRTNTFFNLFCDADRQTGRQADSLSM